MKTPGFAWLSVLLFMGMAAMPSSAHAYSDRRWEPEPSQWTRGVGVWSLETTAAQTSGLPGALGRTEDGLSSVYSGLSSDAPGGAVTPWIAELEALLSRITPSPRDGAGAARPLGFPPAGAVDASGARGTGHHSAAGSALYLPTGSVGTDGRLDLPAWTDAAWSDNPLFAEEETLFMEQVVFPALGAFALVCIATVVIMRHRERKAVHSVRHLLQV